MLIKQLRYIKLFQKLLFLGLQNIVDYELSYSTHCKLSKYQVVYMYIML